MPRRTEAVGTLVDSNVLLDLMTSDPVWASWSMAALADAAESGPLFINPIIYAEVSVRFTRVEDLDEALPVDEFRRLPLPWEASFLAGKAFVAHRRRSRSARSTLPDFFIGAHAAVTELALLTRDERRYRSYFPSVRLISPAR
jgi:predicted nucleic acid-binding protein